MERKGTLIRKKYYEYFLSTLAMSGSASIASIVDRIMIGNLLSSADLNASNLTAPLIYVINVLFALFIYGGNTLAVTYKGKRDQKNADKCFTIAIVVGTLMMALMGLIGLIFHTPLSQGLSAGHEELYQSVDDYLIPVMFLGMLVIPVNGTSAFIRVDGLRKLSIALPIVANAVNLMMDYVLMGPLQWGIAGAGWATNIGYFAAFVLLVPYFRSKNRSVFFTRVGIKDIKLMLESFHVGMATALMYLCMFIKTLVMNVIILSALGVVGGEVTAVCSSVLSVANIFFTGTAQTMLPIGGALYGERDYRGIRHLLRISFTVMEIICVIITAVFLMFPLQVAGIFGVKSAAAQVMIPGAIRLFSLCVPVNGALFILRSHYQSTGYRNTATVLTVLEGTVFFLPILWLLAVLCPDYLWLAHTIAPLLAMAAVCAALQIRAKKKDMTGFLMIPRQDDVAMLDVSIDNKVVDAVGAAHKVVEFCKSSGVDEMLALQMGVAVEELCVNTAKYAFSPRSDTIDLCVSVTDKAVILRLRDNGKIFNPTEYIDDSGKEITGLSLVRQLSSTIEYSRVIGFNVTVVTVDR